MNIPLIIIEKNIIGTSEGLYLPRGTIGYFVTNNGGKIRLKESQEVVEYILLNFNISIRIEDIEKIPYAFPVTLDSLILTSEYQYTSLIPKVQYNSLPVTKSTAFATVDK